MKIFKIISTLLLLSSSALSSAYGGEKWFVAVGGGAFVQPFGKYSSTVKLYNKSQRTHVNTMKHKLDLTASPNFSFGYELADVGAKLQILSDRLRASSSTGINDYKIEQNVMGISAGIYYKFNTHSDFVPFIGAGYGFYRTKFNIDSNTGASFAKNYNQWMWNANIGLAYNISDDFTLSAQYSVRYTRPINLPKVSSGFGYSSGSYLLNTVNVELKYYFW